MDIGRVGAGTGQGLSGAAVSTNGEAPQGPGSGGYAFNDKIDQLTRQEQDLEKETADIGNKVQVLTPRYTRLEKLINIGIMGALAPTTAAMMFVPGAQIPGIILMGVELAALCYVRHKADNKAHEIYTMHSDLSRISDERKTLKANIDYLKSSSKGLSPEDEIMEDEQFVSIDGVRLPRKEGLYQRFKHLLFNSDKPAEEKKS